MKVEWAAWRRWCWEDFTIEQVRNCSWDFGAGRGGGRGAKRRKEMKRRDAERAEKKRI